MIRPLNLIAAFAAGAALMYYLDPQQGRRRRALARDKSVSVGHELQYHADAKRKWMAGRVKGLTAAARTRLSPQPVDDDLLYERIRARLGHVVTHPGAVVVAVEDGVVYLAGRLPDDEAEALLTAVAAIHGVREVQDGLDSGDHPDVVKDAGPWVAAD